jgi:release factor glutamine methyltransferase
MGIAYDRLIVDSEQTLGDTSGYFRLVEKRAAHMPLSRIIGRREFWSLDLCVTDHTFDPRPDSEVLVDTALSVIFERDAALRVADLGTGTGCLLLALLSELRNATGLGLDRNPATVRVASRNAERLGLGGRADFIASDWGSPVVGEFDLIVSNPPYIATAAIGDLAPDVRLHEPRLALDGGEDGFAAYRALAPDLVRLLAPQGHAVVEVGIDQAENVQRLLQATGLTVTANQLDLSGVQRCLVCRSTES